HEVNGCADLRDTIAVSSSPPTIAGKVISDNSVCAGTNSTSLILNGQSGNILNWIYSSDGVSWTAIANTTNSYTAQNLSTTTQYKALVQNGSSCSIDSSAAAVIIVSPKTVGGMLSPDKTDICAGQSVNSFLNLTGNTGSVVNWQLSNDNVNWINFSPVKTDSGYNVKSITATTSYRAIVQSGVCPADTSLPAVVNFINVPFPAATIDPRVSSICYGKSVQLNANITNGTSYTWTNSSTLTNQGNGIVNTLPYPIHATAAPLQTGDYVLTINNAGCPNSLKDTFHVEVTLPIKVFAGNDTSIVIGQQLQLNATANDPLANVFTWTPSTGLSSADIFNPVANLDAWAGSSITYIVRATNIHGCYGEDNIKVTVFKTRPDIFVPSAFSPNGDGRNDVIRPICVGITQLNYFNIYNRWGQLIFTTSEMNKGWDGTISGIPQATANFVFIARGVDFTGKVIERKGNITLIR
ncbi:MAG: T9SS type B sorting domain-containing protein, partial [Bacteroidota bacterium]